MIFLKHNHNLTGFKLLENLDCKNAFIDILWSNSEKILAFFLMVSLGTLFFWLVWETLRFLIEESTLSFVTNAKPILLFFEFLLSIISILEWFLNFCIITWIGSSKLPVSVEKYLAIIAYFYRGYNISRLIIKGFATILIHPIWSCYFQLE